MRNTRPPSPLRYERQHAEWKQNELSMFMSKTSCLANNLVLYVIWNYGIAAIWSSKTGLAPQNQLQFTAPSQPQLAPTLGLWHYNAFLRTMHEENDEDTLSTHTDSWYKMCSDVIAYVICPKSAIFSGISHTLRYASIHEHSHVVKNIETWRFGNILNITIFNLLSNFLSYHETNRVYLSTGVGSVARSVWDALYLGARIEPSSCDDYFR